MNPKYYRATGPRANVCPWCGVEANRITGQNCGHLYKVTVKGVWFWFWGVRPIASKDAEQQETHTNKTTTEDTMRRLAVILYGEERLAELDALPPLHTTEIA